MSLDPRVGYPKHSIPRSAPATTRGEKGKDSHNFAKTPLKAAQAPLATASTIHIGCRRHVASMDDTSIIFAPPVCVLVASFASSRPVDRTGGEGGTFAAPVPVFSRLLLPLPRFGCRCRACDIVRRRRIDGEAWSMSRAGLGGCRTLSTPYCIFSCGCSVLRREVLYSCCDWRNRRRILRWQGLECCRSTWSTSRSLPHSSIA